MRYLGAVSRYLDLSRYFDVSPSTIVYFAAGASLPDAQALAAVDGGYVVDLATAASITLNCQGVPQGLFSSLLVPLVGTGSASNCTVTFEFDPVGSLLVIGSALTGASAFSDGYNVPAKQVTITFDGGAGSVTQGFFSCVLVCR